MFLGAYHFTGQPDALLPAYDRLMASMPPDAIALNVCVVSDAGITVYDACPARAVFEEFSSSGDFLGAVAHAGLPNPRVELLGDVHAARLRESVRP